MRVGTDVTVKTILSASPRLRVNPLLFCFTRRRGDAEKMA